MKFIDLYKENKKAIIEAMISMWCTDGRTDNDVDKQYADKLRCLIEGGIKTSDQNPSTEGQLGLFSSEEYMPLVQCMDSYTTVHSVSANEAKQIVGDLWKSRFDPYEHQYLAWDTLLNKNKSIVVTTGTGSGKTECFMLPLVHDLKMQQERGKIMAIFLYPLNALMEDQKKRLQSLLDGTDLHFAVYNGNMIEDYVSANVSEQQRVDEERLTYQNIVATRVEMRRKAPEIILTNPTMLEYMLLRQKDQILFTRNSLRWIVIDETHTFNGAGAAELALLLRRVLYAFGMDAADPNLRFATSSATIGNNPQYSSRVNPIQEFISKITGKPLRDVVEIPGDRNFVNSGNPKIDQYRKVLIAKEYVKLNELIQEGNSIEEKLEILDNLCDETINGRFALKAKVHFFYRVPNNGLWVRLDEHKNGAFKVYSAKSPNSPTPYLELYRCNHCGGYFAIGEYQEGDTSHYGPVTLSEGDLFSEENNDLGNRIIFGLSNNPSASSNISVVKVTGDTIKPQKQQHGANVSQGWHVVTSGQRCPHCNSDLFERSDSENFELGKHATAFRLSSSFITKTLAPSILPLMHPKPGIDIPHNGQQYISFVDSRQEAAKNTLDQNLEQERLWLYSRLYREFGQVDIAKINKIRQQIQQLEALPDMEDILAGKKAELARLQDKKLSWMDVHDLLLKQPECELLSYQFANKKEGSIEIDPTTDKVTSETKSKYIHSLMLSWMAKRPITAASPENYGLWSTCYPKLDTITSLPPEVREFNKALPNNTQIDVENWKNLLKIFLDYTIRSNESIYFKENASSTLDIFELERFATSKPRRRPITPPQIIKKGGPYGRVTRLLGALLQGNPGESMNDLIYRKRDIINPVLTALSQTLINVGLIAHGQSNKNGTWQLDAMEPSGDIPYRLNLLDISFHPIRKAYLCAVRPLGVKYDVLRPSDILFMGYSPYIIDNNAVKPIKEIDWTDEGNRIDWAKNSGFYNKLTTIYSCPKIFIQAEHTAQVDKIIAKQSQMRFVKQQINILACSTTMEMGVDLGNLELVMMQSVPPHPTNYKQRAGRSGRNEDTRSACITLCSSDAVGFRTLLDPIGQLILRPMTVPYVDLQSQAVVRRHANAFLLRESGILNSGSNTTNNLGDEIIDFFTSYHFYQTPGSKGQSGYVIMDEQGQNIYPSDKLGDKQKTNYWLFLDFINTISPSVMQGLGKIMDATCFSGMVSRCISNCKKDIKDVYKNLEGRINDICEAYETELQKSQSSSGTKICDTPYGRLLRHKYSDCLAQTLLTFLATHRFTPNANMPVNIIEYRANLAMVARNNYGFRKTNDPSYSLQQALSQYVPGNTVVLENRTSIVRGIEYTGQYRRSNTFKKLYFDGINVEIDRVPSGSQKTWPTSGKTDLTLIQPVSFIPDINESSSRAIDNNYHTRVNAMLIGASTWTGTQDKLFDIRSNRDDATAKILYYNEGVRNGYCFCPKCGKMMIEQYPGSVIPSTFNNQTDKQGNPFHYMINRKNSNGQLLRCLAKSSDIERNVIIGDLVQTDYCEIVIKRRDGLTIRAIERDEDVVFNTVVGQQTIKKSSKLLLPTLGLLFKQALADRLGKDRREIDFLIMPTGHICIFDTNPGGSGYSNQLASMRMMCDVIDDSLNTLKNIRSIDQLVDKSTIKYINQLDVEVAEWWLTEAKNAFKSVPDCISSIFPRAKSSTLEDLFNSMTSGGTIYVGNNWESWNYTGDENNPGLKNKLDTLRTLGLDQSEIHLCIVNTKEADIPVQIASNLSQIEDWATLSICNIESSSWYPLAKVGDNIYFSTLESSNEASTNWGKGDIYIAPMTNLIQEEKLNVANLLASPNVMKFTLNSADDTEITSINLGSLIEMKMDNLWQKFKSLCQNSSESTIRITYQDEHLKSPLAMIVTIQFICHFVDQLSNAIKEVTFIGEQYQEIHMGSSGIATNIEQYDDRDNKLKTLTEHLGYNVVVSSKPCKTLPHWRVLTIECGNHKLEFYPNGGIINEWFLNKKECKKFYGIDTNASENIPIKRVNDIMYDVVLR